MPWSMIKECVSFAHFVVPEWKGNTSIRMSLVQDGLEVHFVWILLYTLRSFDCFYFCRMWLFSWLYYMRSAIFINNFLVPPFWVHNASIYKQTNRFPSFKLALVFSCELQDSNGAIRWKMKQQTLSVLTQQFSLLISVSYYEPFGTACMMVGYLVSNSNEMLARHNFQMWKMTKRGNETTVFKTKEKAPIYYQRKHLFTVPYLTKAHFSNHLFSLKLKGFISLNLWSVEHKSFAFVRIFRVWICYVEKDIIKIILPIAIIFVLLLVVNWSNLAFHKQRKVWFPYLCRRKGRSEVE